jgi:hypothetical protein
VKDYERRPRDPEEEPLARESEPVADVLQLQRSAGNRAVSSLLARQPSAEKEKAATMTAGLGDDIGVIPIDSFGWGSTGSPGNTGKGHSEVHEVSITCGLNAAAAAIHQAAAEGRPIPAAFISTQKMTIDFTDVLLSGYSESEQGLTVTLNFASMKLRP